MWNLGNYWAPGTMNVQPLRDGIPRDGWEKLQTTPGKPSTVLWFALDISVFHPFLVCKLIGHVNVLKQVEIRRETQHGG